MAMEMKTFQIDPAVNKQLRAYCSVSGRTQGHVINEALRMYLTETAKTAFFGTYWTTIQDDRDDAMRRLTCEKEERDKR